ncbi:MAG: PstS family phosphate ABC transporter substrate-binding protein [Puniceicoccaceae bacterium]
MRLHIRNLCPLLLALVLPVLPLSSMTLTGSDLLGPAIQAALQEQLNAAGLDAELAFGGSLLAMQELQEGTADAAILAVPGSDSSPGGRTFPFGFQIVALAVHTTNPVTELTYGQLTSIFEQDGVLNNWSDLTAALEWRDRKISLWAVRSKSAITLEIFNAVVLQGSPLKDSVRYTVNDTEELQALIIENPSALVAVPAIPLTPSIRFLGVKGDESGQAYTPSEDNVLFGDYPLRLPFYLTVQDSLSEEDLGKLVRAIYSPEVTAALRSVNYMPVPETERQSLLAEFE